MATMPNQRWILAAAAAGLIARLAFGLLYWTAKPMTHDEREYLALAQSLQQGRGLHYPPGHQGGTAAQFGRAPGYPAFLALLAAPGDTDAAPTRIKVAQSVLGALVVWMIGVIAMRAAGLRAGEIAAWIAAF